MITDSPVRNPYYGRSIRLRNQDLLFNIILTIISLILLKSVQAENLSSLPGSFSGTIENDTTSNKTILPHKYIDPSTLLIINDSNSDTLHIDRDFDFDATLGLLTWKITPPPIMKVQFRFLPISVTDTLIHYTETEARQADSLVEGETINLLQDLRQRQKDDIFSRSNLRRNGHIMRGVQVGSGRDLSLESGLRLALDGKITRDIEVSALLDDRNLPIHPEGSSRRLEEIDQVYVDIRTRRANGRFGDYNLEFQGGRYGTFSRRLEGGQVEYRHPDIKVKAAGAVTKAQFHSNRFQGIDGIQGPYELTGQNGEHPVLIEGGTEKVWVDGVLRQRGETADYIIDYTRGEIIFTPGLPITSESRIEVDFEYSTEVFPRNLYAGQVETSNPSRSFRAIANYIEEGDDSDRPIGFEMTPELRRFLSKQGNSTDAALFPVADSLGVNSGDYIRVDTTWTDSTYIIFQYVQPDVNGNPRGSWSVLFSFVGSGNGAYERVPIVGGYSFKWVGPANGDYAPVRLVPLPERRRQGTLSLQASPTSWFKASVDLAASGHDMNTLSQTGDENNTGFARNSSLTFSLPTNQKISPLEANFHARDEGKDFRPFARSREVEYERRWGVDNLEEGVSERERGLKLTGRPVKGVTLLSGYSKLDRGGLFKSERRTGGANLNIANLRTEANIENIESDDKKYDRHSDWLRTNGMARYMLGIWMPGFETEWENKDENSSDTLFTGHRYLRWNASWSLTDWQGHAGKVNYEQRHRDGQQSKDHYGRVYNEDAAGIKWAYHPLSYPWRSEVEINHREKRYTLADSADVTTDLASLLTSFNPYNGALAVDFQYRLNRTVTRQSALIAYKVPTGEGDYIRVGDEYFYDPEIGDYILRSEPGDSTALPTTDLKSAMNIDWSPHRLPDGKGKIDGFGWEDISLVTNLEAAERTRWEKPSDIYLINIAKYQTDFTVDGRLAWRQDFHLFRSSRDFSSRLRYNTEKRLVNLFLTGAERHANDSWELRVRKSLDEQTDIESEGKYTRTLKSLARRDTPDRFRLRRGNLKLSYRPSKKWILSITTRGLRDSQLADPSPVSGFGVQPGVSFRMRDKGRINMDFEALWIETGMDRVPFELADGRPKGRNGRGNLIADVQLGTHLTGRASYTVRLDQGREPVHIARMEVSALF
ncbi:MAG: hypothetical protein P9L92_02225 [Candidatus Electryonea clarkiae]|nr:hypothetical protein [Candidatus Electryonea clarkiae]MDP8287323.1 hypothetical protein [Candidatus Electryonea clarkiae]